jgi:ApbE superfamily uncharacterized protein (UPF0280 family)
VVSCGDSEADGGEKAIEVVHDALVEAVELREPVGSQSAVMADGIQQSGRHCQIVAERRKSVGTHRAPSASRAAGNCLSTSDTTW